MRRNIGLGGALVFVASMAAAQHGYPDVSVPNHSDTQFPLDVRIISKTPQGDFAILVTPNLVSYDRALRQASDAASRYCAGRSEGPVARIEEVDRYSDIVLDAYSFSGFCGDGTVRLPPDIRRNDDPVDTNGNLLGSEPRVSPASVPTPDPEPEPQPDPDPDAS